MTSRAKAAFAGTLGVILVALGLFECYSLGYHHGSVEALRKPRDVPARVPRNVPICTIWLSSRTNLDFTAFNGAMQQFAKLHGFQECQLTSWSFHAGPKIRLASFINDKFVIWSDKNRYQLNPLPCSLSVAPRHRWFSAKEFDGLTNALVSALEAEFPGRIKARSESHEDDDSGT